MRLPVCLAVGLDLSQFDSAPLIAFAATKEMNSALHGRVMLSMIPRVGLKRADEFRQDAVRITLTSGLTRKQVADDLGVGMSTLNKWITAHPLARQCMFERGDWNESSVSPPDIVDCRRCLELCSFQSMTVIRLSCPGSALSQFS